MNIKQCSLLTFAALILSGCITAKPVFGPDGQQAHAITCTDSIGASWSDCFEKAGQICGTRGYKVWNKATSESGLIAGDEESILGSSSDSLTLLISCKDERQHASVTEAAATP